MEAVLEQPWLFEIPQAPKRIRSKWEELQEMVEVSRREGGLLAPATCAVLLDISRQRMHQLMEGDRFTKFEFLGSRLISVRELNAFARTERPTGRPSLGKMLKNAFEAGDDYVAEIYGEKKGKK